MTDLVKTAKPDKPITLSDQELLANAERQFRAFQIFNREKLNNIVRALDDTQKSVFRLLPVFLHSAAPEIPDVPMDAPVGIASYRIPKETTGLKRTLRLERDATRVQAGRKTTRLFRRDPAIEFVAVMGSVGSVAQTEKSDLDYWVCVRETLDPDDQKRLRAKLDAIESWCDRTANMEVHFFLRTPEELRKNDYGEVDAESCGSALAKLLKEEFYRASALQAGRPPLWWLTPPGCSDEVYNRVGALAGEAESLRGASFIDIGGVAGISRGEFAGGTLWQLTKALNSPFKSVLKMALLLDYFDESRTPLMLCDMLKRNVARNPTDTRFLDPYILMFERTEGFFRKSGREDITELLRTCFLLKVHPDFASEEFERSHHWAKKHLVMLDYIQKWRWEARKVFNLEKFSTWPFREKMALRDDISRFMTGAQLVLERKLGDAKVEGAITQRDRMVLLRQLEVAYDDQKPHKIEFIPSPYRARVGREAFTFLEREIKDGATRWELHTGNPEPETLLEPGAEARALRMAATLTELASWMFQNSFYNVSAKFVVHSERSLVLERNLRMLFQRMARFFELSRRKPEPDAYLSQPRKDRVLCIANLAEARDGTDALSALDARQDVLNYGKQRRNLVRDITLVYTNTWGEFFCKNFTGPDSLENALLDLLGEDFLKREVSPDAFADIFVADGRMVSPPIEPRLREILSQAGRFFLQEAAGRNVRHRRFVFEAGGRLVALDHSDGRMTLARFENIDKFLAYSATKTTAATLTSFDAGSPSLAKHNFLMGKWRLGKVAVFIDRTTDPVHVWVLDEMGGIHQNIVAPRFVKRYATKLYAFLRTAIHRVMDREMVSSLYGSAQDAWLSVHEITHRDGRFITRDLTDTYLREYRQKPRAGEILEYHRRVVFPETSNRPENYFVVGDELVSVYVAPGDLLTAVAQRVIAARRGGGRYPVFIIDVDFDDIAFQSDFGDPILCTSHFLRLKHEMEARINQRIQRL